MPDCSYCEESFGDEDAYLDHLAAAHDDELGPIDRRRVGGGEESGVGTRTILLGIVAVLPIVALVYVLFFTGSAPGNASLDDPETMPTGIDSVHEHGTINVTVDGRELDFGRSEFQRAGQYRAFHFEDGDGEVWHVHARRVTLEYAMWTLGIGVSADALRYDGTTYRDGENATVIVEVNGDPVDPTEYVLSGSPRNAQQGDHIRIVVRTGG
jgi:hypothetical protein